MMSNDENRKLRYIASGRLAKLDNIDREQSVAADKIVDILMGDATFSNDDDSVYGVPQDLLDKAGTALASRYCFAIVCYEGMDECEAMITPIRHFEKEGACSDQTGPIDHLLPQCATSMESTWEVYADNVTTAVDVAKFLQDKGFVWNQSFQNFIDPEQIEEISKALTVTQNKPSNGAKPKF